MNRLHERRAHQRRAADHAIEPRVVRHFDDGRHAASFVADHDAERVEEFDFAARVRAVAELVFQTLDLHGVLAAVGREARHEKSTTGPT